MSDYEKLPNRDESRYTLDPTRAQDVHTHFNTLFIRTKYPNPVTQTAHLAGKNLDHPPSYLRLRRYVPASGEEAFTLDPDELWFFEHKQKSGAKERIRRPLGEILVGTSYPELEAFDVALPSAYQVLRQFGRPLMPIFATQSLRTHYHAPGARLTIDEQLSYYGIRWGELHAHRLGSLPAIKVEFKAEEPVLSSTAAKQFDSICQQLGGAPATDGETAKDMFMAYQEFIGTEKYDSPV